MPIRLDDTIAAISSAPGGAARGIVRVSGPGTIEIVRELFQASDGTNIDGIRLPTAVPGEVRLSGLASPLPVDLSLWPTNRSYTRQPLAELHTLGSPPLLHWLLETVCAAGARLAEPGEFTLRAFFAGRLDLTQAEAVLGVIDADDPNRLNAALRQLAGGLSGPLAALRESLLDLLAHLEAGLDFVEEDIEFISPAQLEGQLADAAAKIDRLIEQLGSRGCSDEAFRVALTGWPNVGKSSLFNALAGGRAIVSNVPGTTRDYLIATLETASLSSRRVELIDTAGVEYDQPEQSIAAGAQSLSTRETREADLRLLCLEAGRPLNDWEREQLAAPDPRRLIVLTKADAGLAWSPPAELSIAAETSTVTGVGIAELRGLLIRHAAEGDEHDTSAVASTSARCRDSLRMAAECLSHARELTATRAGEELIAAEVRLALAELGKVVGAVYTDDILDRVFSRFCIGK